MTPPGAVSTATLERGCALIRMVLAAEDVYVVRSGDPHFIRVDAPGDPTAYELKQKGYFLIWKALSANTQLVGSLFSAADRRVSVPAALAAGVPATHLALRLPSDESTSELLIVRGPWPDGLTTAQLDFVIAARPMLAYLVGTLLDTQRWERQREQLHSLSTVAAVLTHANDPAAALPAIATAVAKVSGFEWATLTLVNERLDRVTARVINQARYSETETAALSREGALMRDSALANARHFTTTRLPLLYPNIFAANHELPLTAAATRYFERAHILSLALFPLWSGDRLLGTLSFSSSTARRFAPTEVEFLAMLCEQTVMAIEWLQLHQELSDANAALARAATHDALTGLPNRVLFLDRLTQTLVRAQRTGGTVAVLFIDLDNFKAVNDRHGHKLGDRLLQVVAQRLQGTLRASDTAARLGGDEFTVVQGDVAGEVEAQVLAERLRVALHEPVEIAGHHLVQHASIGVACCTAGDCSAESLLHEADLAMYQAKVRGDGRSFPPRETAAAAIQPPTREAELQQEWRSGADHDGECPPSCGQAAAPEPEADGDAAGDRRLWHRLFGAQLPQPLRGRPAQA